MSKQPKICQCGRTLCGTTENIRSRDDLSFTKRDEQGILINWEVQRHPKKNWGADVEIGRDYFKEIIELANIDPREAILAIETAISSSPEFSRYGAGIECGFSEEIAKMAVYGIRQKAKRMNKEAK